MPPDKNPKGEMMDAKERLKVFDNERFDIEVDRPNDVLQFTLRVQSAKIQALIEIREALDRLTEEVKAGRNRSI